MNIRNNVFREVLDDYDAFLEALDDYYENYSYCNRIAAKGTEIKKVIYNPPATIVFWADGTKTVVKCAKSDDFDQEKGLAMCICKRFFDNDAQYHKTFKKFCTEKSPAKPAISTSADFLRIFKDFCSDQWECKCCALKEIDPSLSCEDILQQYPEKAASVIERWYSSEVLGY